MRPSEPQTDEEVSADSPVARAYWRANRIVMVCLLAAWFAVSFGAGILLVKPLNRLHMPGTDFPLGFWFAQVGSVLAFVVLVFAYAWIMNRIDRRFGFAED